MEKNTVILIGISVIAVCVTIVVCMKSSAKNKAQSSIWSSKSYSADAMNSLVDAFQTAAAEGGAGDSLW